MYVVVSVLFMEAIAWKKSLYVKNKHFSIKHTQKPKPYNFGFHSAKYIAEFVFLFKTKRDEKKKNIQFTKYFHDSCFFLFLIKCSHALLHATHILFVTIIIIIVMQIL